MEGLQNVYYALGEMAYAVAKSDGSVNAEERKKIHDIVMQETAGHNVDFDVAEIIFHILKKDDIDTKTTYDWAMNEFRKNKEFLTRDMVIDFIAVAEKVAVASNSYTRNEKSIVNQFRKEISELVGL